MQILDAQMLIRTYYGKTSEARGLQGNFTRYVEEVGELAKAMRKKDRANLEEELADNLAFLLTLSFMNDVDLDAVFCKKYGQGICFRCKQSQCICPEEGK